MKPGTWANPKIRISGDLWENTMGNYGLMGFNGDMLGFNEPKNRDVSGYTLWLCQYIAIENGPVEIMDFPIKNGGSFHSYVSLPGDIPPKYGLKYGTVSTSILGFWNSHCKWENTIGYQQRCEFMIDKLISYQSTLVNQSEIGWWFHNINGNFRILKWRYCTIFQAIFSGDIPWN